MYKLKPNTGYEMHDMYTHLPILEELMYYMPNNKYTRIIVKVHSILGLGISIPKDVSLILFVYCGLSICYF